MNVLFRVVQIQKTIHPHTQLQFVLKHISVPYSAILGTLLTIQTLPRSIIPVQYTANLRLKESTKQSAPEVHLHFLSPLLVRFGAMKTRSFPSLFLLFPLCFLCWPGNNNTPCCLPPHLHSSISVLNSTNIMAVDIVHPHR